MWYVQLCSHQRLHQNNAQWGWSTPRDGWFTTLYILSGSGQKTKGVGWTSMLWPPNFQVLCTFNLLPSLVRKVNMKELPKHKHTQPGSACRVLAWLDYGAGEVSICHLEQQRISNPVPWQCLVCSIEGVGASCLWEAFLARLVSERKRRHSCYFAS